MPLFFFLLLSERPPTTAQKSLLTAFAFRGYSYKGESANGSQMAKNGARKGNGNEANTETPTETAFFRLLTAFHGFTLLTTPPKAETPTTAKFDSFTAHGLKAPNGSQDRRTVRGSAAPTPRSDPRNQKFPRCAYVRPYVREICCICRRQGAKSDVAQSTALFFVP